MEYKSCRITVPEVSDEAVACALLFQAGYDKASPQFRTDSYTKGRGSRCIFGYCARTAAEAGALNALMKTKPVPDYDFLVVRVSRRRGFFEARKRGGAAWDRTDEYEIEFNDKIDPSLVAFIGAPLMEKAVRELHATIERKQDAKFLQDPIFV
ncbi:MAG: hypothetical protein HY514_03215 [Candidatus Aenigmarchaeota archaeon]|nr:hypothetical protein [Candidatus Aenigmarchaeota archaeon]